MAASQYITEEIGKVVAAMRDGGETPYYMYGHRLEISNRLTEKGKDKTLKYKKYPLIALRMNIPARREGNLWTYPNLDIAILEMTERNLNAEQRMEQVFYPKLFPLYNRFLKELKNSGLFLFSGEVPSHEPIIKPYWGVSETGEGTKANIFLDPLDAIEIEGLELSQRVKIC